MKKQVIIVLILIGLFGIFSSVKAQTVFTNSVIEVGAPNLRLDKPILSGSLSGVVENLDGKKLENVKVERFSDDWKSIIETVFTDKKGRFKFSKVPSGNYNLRFNWFIITKPSFLEVTVTVKKKIATMEFKLPTRSNLLTNR
jgi:5-hydroxyisourate hydrolase-like protein (transthyretin family)